MYSLPRVTHLSRLMLLLGIMVFFSLVFSRTAGRLVSHMSTFTIVVPVTAVLAVEGSPSTVTVRICGDVANVTITTAPATVTPPVPSEFWQHDPEDENDPWLQGR